MAQVTTLLTRADSELALNVNQQLRMILLDEDLNEILDFCENLQ